MKEIVNKIKNNMNKITVKLTLGISSIVFISTLIIGLIFLSQYRDLSLKQTEIDLMEKSNQLAEFGNVILSSNVNYPKEKLFNSLKRITDFDFWILSNSGSVIVSTTKILLIDDLTKLNTKFINKLDSADSFITYDYSNYFDNKTLTVITPIIENNHIIGAIMLHKDVNLIYSSNAYFTFLIFISLMISLVISITMGIFYSRYFTKPIKIITDVTKKIASRDYNIKTNIKAYDEIGELAVAIDTMSSEINKNIEEIKGLESRAKELVANVSHEFKTPLTLIRGYVENIQDKTTKPSKQVYDKIITNTQILEKLINELLDLSRFQSGTVILKKESLELKQLVKDVIGDMKNLAKNKSIKIKLIEEYKDEQIINADYVKIRQLLTIFMDNAIKYSNSSSEINIVISNGKLTISDSGIGIEKSKLEQLFERYYQIDSTQKGYGLGLCIAKYIADAHDYKISIDSVENVGTTVEIKFLY